MQLCRKEIADRSTLVAVRDLHQTLMEKVDLQAVLTADKEREQQDLSDDLEILVGEVEQSAQQYAQRRRDQQRGVAVQSPEDGRVLEELLNTVRQRDAAEQQRQMYHPARLILRLFLIEEPADPVADQKDRNTHCAAVQHLLTGAIKDNAQQR